MAKLPWYIKDNGPEFKDGQIFVSLKVRRIYILWVKIQVFFTMLFDEIKTNLKALPLLPVIILALASLIAFTVFVIVIYGTSAAIAWVLEKLF
jgi:hypothetical protein